MFEKPTINDHLGQVNLILEEAGERTGKRTAMIEADAAGKGAYHGNRLAFPIAEVAREEHDAAVEKVLELLQRSLKMPELDPQELRWQTYQRLAVFTKDMQSFSKLDKFIRTKHPATALLQGEIDKLLERLKLKLRAFDVGYFPNPEQGAVSVTNNNMTVETIIGQVQQGTSNSTQTQTVTIDLDIGAITLAVEALQEALADSAVSPRDRELLQPDLDTIRAQMRKPSPSKTILQEAGKSLRSIAEGIVGGALTPAVMTGLAALAAALGL